LDLLTVRYTRTLNYTYIQQYSAIAQLHNLQTTVAHALGFSVSTSRLLATALNTQIIRVSRAPNITHDMRENALIVASLLMRSRDLSHSCVIQVFIAVAWQQTRRGDATR
jgi:hypothetical protein